MIMNQTQQLDDVKNVLNEWMNECIFPLKWKDTFMNEKRVSKELKLQNYSQIGKLFTNFLISFLTVNNDVQFFKFFGALFHNLTPSFTNVFKPCSETPCSRIIWWFSFNITI